jgi:hypothetical protein
MKPASCNPFSRGAACRKNQGGVKLLVKKFEGEMFSIPDFRSRADSRPILVHLFPGNAGGSVRRHRFEGGSGLAYRRSHMNPIRNANHISTRGHDRLLPIGDG